MATVNGGPEIVFDRSLEHGWCVIVRIPRVEGELAALADSALPAEERAACAAYLLPRRRTFVGGRVALRVALARAGLDAPPILMGPRGAPALPAGVLGSISHKDDFAAGLVTPADGDARVGVDVETDVEHKLDISTKVLIDEELGAIARLPPRDRTSAVLLRFSAKESIYKAIDPFVQRYVGFKEVAVFPRDDGTARVAATLKEGEGPFDIAVRWALVDGLILTTARAAPHAKPAESPNHR